MKLKLTYIRLPRGTTGCIPESHYDLHTDEPNPSNVACIFYSGKEEVKVLRRMVKLYNEEQEVLENAKMAMEKAFQK